MAGSTKDSVPRVNLKIKKLLIVTCLALFFIGVPCKCIVSSTLSITEGQKACAHHDLYGNAICEPLKARLGCGTRAPTKLSSEGSLASVELYARANRVQSATTVATSTGPPNRMLFQTSGIVFFSRLRYHQTISLHLFNSILTI